MYMAKSNENMIGSGFNCPTIGSAIPKGYTLACGSDGKWQIVRKQVNNKRADNLIAKKEGMEK